jgi:ATP-dependent Clp protease protease subunit
MNSPMNSKVNCSTDDDILKGSKIFEKFINLRTIVISGEINKTLADRVTKQLLILEGESDKPIDIYIDSPGGDADAGFAIFDFIRFVTPEVRIIASGLAASAGSLILLAAKPENRLSMPNARILIHQPLGGAQGSATEIEIQAGQILKLKERINRVISEETGKPIEVVARDTERDFWMTPEEAKDYGIISNIVKNRADLK